MPAWLKSKYFWINFLLILAQIIEYSIANNLFTGKIVAIEGGIQVLINYILQYLQEKQIVSLKSKVAKLEKR